MPMNKRMNEWVSEWSGRNNICDYLTYTVLYSREWCWLLNLYCPLLKRMMLTLTSAVCLNTRDDSRKKTYKYCQKYVCITLNWSPYITCFVYNNLKLKFVRSSNNTEHYRK
jgi:hypothetical protein